MGILLKQIFAFIRLLHSESGTRSMAVGLTLGMVMGFAPFLSLQTILVFLILLTFRIQFGSALVSAFFFKFVAWLVDSPADLLGRTVLESESLRPLFTVMHNIPFLPFTRFNNSIVMGSLLISLILAIPGYYLFNRLIEQYRVQVVARIRDTKVWKAVAATKFFGLYLKYDQLRGDQ